MDNSVHCSPNPPPASPFSGVLTGSSAPLGLFAHPMMLLCPTPSILAIPLGKFTVDGKNQTTRTRPGLPVTKQEALWYGRAMPLHPCHLAVVCRKMFWRGGGACQFFLLRTTHRDTPDSWHRPGPSCPQVRLRFSLGLVPRPDARHQDPQYQRPHSGYDMRGTNLSSDRTPFLPCDALPLASLGVRVVSRPKPRCDSAISSL